MINLFSKKIHIFLSITILLILSLVIMKSSVLSNTPDKTGQQTVKKKTIKIHRRVTKRFVPIDIRTETLTATGKASGFNPVDITVPTLRATGIPTDFTPVIIEIPVLTARGVPIGFEPVTITIQTLTATGKKNN